MRLSTGELYSAREGEAKVPESNESLYPNTKPPDLSTKAVAIGIFEIAGHSAKGAKCYSLGQRPRYVRINPVSAEGAKYNFSHDHFGDRPRTLIPRFQRLGEITGLPGPLAQAFTFRAFGA